MIARLADTAVAIRMGFGFRSAIKRVPTGNVVVIQMKDVSREGRLATDELYRTYLPELNPDQMVRPGDVVFKARGEMNVAAEVSELEGNAVAAAPLMVIRADQAKVLPAFLAWSLNQPPAQRHFDQMATGTYLRQITTDVVADLEIEVPSIAVQHRILELAALAQREKDLTMEIAEKRKAHVDALLLRMAKGSGA